MKTRNVGIDLLRITSMFMITVLHILGHGGVFGNLKLFSPQYYVVTGLYCFCNCAVNCFAIISGFVSSSGTGKRKYARLLYLWLEIVFYQVVMVIVFSIAGYNTPTVKQVLQCFFPISFYQYWYMSAYFGLMIISPFLDEGYEKIEKHERFIFVCFLCVIICIPTLIKQDPYCTNIGFSTLWLIVLYLLGKTLKDINDYLQKRWGIIALGICFIVTILSKIALDTIKPKIYWLEQGDLLIAYTSPTIVIESVAIVVLFSKIRFNNQKLIRNIIRISSLSLGIYLFHDNLLFRKIVLNDSFLNVILKNPIVLLLLILFYALIINCIGYGGECIRVAIFKLLRLDAFCYYICGRINRAMVNKLQVKLQKGIDKDE